MRSNQKGFGDKYQRTAAKPANAHVDVAVMLPRMRFVNGFICLPLVIFLVVL